MAGAGADDPVLAQESSVITIFGPGGIGEVTADVDLATAILAATDAHPLGPLRDGDIVVVTSKIISKAQGRIEPASRRTELITSETSRTVARRGETRIVRTHDGLTIAAAGIDTSNLSAESILLLPLDPDGSAAALRERLEIATNLRLGVIISDTAGRPWRIGQTDHAIGVSGVRVLEDYAGARDAYGNELQVTVIAVADELAAAADLVKGKLRGVSQLRVSCSGTRTRTCLALAARRRCWLPRWSPLGSATAMRNWSRSIAQNEHPACWPGPHWVGKPQT